VCIQEVVEGTGLMEPRYNIYFAGQLLPGHELAIVRPKLAKLFNANEQVLDKLFSGKPQLLKKGCDKGTALKYKQAMERAGAQAVVKTVAAPGAEPQAAVEAPPPPMDKKMTAAERIAALAAAPDTGTYEPPAAEQTVTGDTAVGLAPVGADVLRPEERAEPVSAQVDTSGLEIDSNAQRLSKESPPPPPAPDTSHLHMGAVGEDIPTLMSDREPLSPNTEGLNLSPEGTDFADCAAPEAVAPNLDLSALKLAPEGSDVLDEHYRKKEQATAPATDHLSLDE
jgi:hypothetical protein